MRLRRDGLAREVVAQVEGRPLAHAETADGHWLVGTRTHLVVVGPHGAEHVPWERLEGAHWDRDESMLRISGVGRWGEPRPSYSFAMPEQEPGNLLQLVRERVTASVVLQRGHLVTDRRGFKVIGRRSPAGGPISWMFEYDAGIDPDDPTVSEAAAALLRRAREDVGE